MAHHLSVMEKRLEKMPRDAAVTTTSAAPMRVVPLVVSDGPEAAAFVIAAGIDDPRLPDDSRRLAALFATCPAVALLRAGKIAGMICAVKQGPGVPDHRLDLVCVLPEDLSSAEADALARRMHADIEQNGYQARHLEALSGPCPAGLASPDQEGTGSAGTDAIVFSGRVG